MGLTLLFSAEEGKTEVKQAKSRRKYQIACTNMNTFDHSLGEENTTGTDCALIVLEEGPTAMQRVLNDKHDEPICVVLCFLIKTHATCTHWGRGGGYDWLGLTSSTGYVHLY